MAIKPQERGWPKTIHLMEKVERNGCCVGGLLLATALLPPPIRPPIGRRRWGRPTVPGRPCCRRGASRSWRRDSTASFSTWVGGFLTVAHVVPKRPLVARELNSKLRVPSEPIFRADPIELRREMWATLVVWAIYHLGSVFFPRVRTPCGHGAQVIVEGREEQSDGGERNRETQHHTKQTKHHNPGPTGRVSTIL